MDPRTTLRRGRWAALVALGLVLGAAAAPAAAAGSAQPSPNGSVDAGPCSPVSLVGVPDKALAPVLTAFQGLAATGVVPVLRVWQDVPEADLDSAVAALPESCDAWSGGPTTLAPSVVVLAVSLDDRRSGVYYGSDEDVAFDGWWEDMLTGTVNPLLKKGKTADALAAGLTALTERVTEEAASAPAGSDTSGISGPSDAGGGQGGVDPSADCPDCVGDPAFGGGFGGDGFGGSSGSGVGAVVALGVVGLVVSGALAAAGVGSGRGRARASSTFLGTTQDPMWTGSTFGHGSSSDSGSSFGGFDSGGSSGSSDSGSSGGDMGGGSTSW